MSAKHVFFTLALLLAAAPVAYPQHSTGLGVARVTLVAGPSPSRGAPIEVVRHATRVPRNLILVDRNATAEDLAAALALFNALRTQHGDSPTSDIRARPASVRPRESFVSSAYRVWLVEQLARLRRASVVNVPYLGSARAVVIAVPPPNGVISVASGRK